MTEIIFEVQEDDIDGGLVAHALGAGLHTEGDTLDDLKANIRNALECHFDVAEMPHIRLQSVSRRIALPARNAAHSAAGGRAGGAPPTLNSWGIT